MIAGSDRRGTVYGLYDLSEQIGISPWYWWADVPVQKHSALYVKPGRTVRGEPAVKYRGIFINDEAPAMDGWAREKFGGFNHELYAHVFELILRLRGNYMWPAMWDPHAFDDDDARNIMLADEYGIVLGTSHHEPMMRAHDEWQILPLATRATPDNWNRAVADGVRRVVSTHTIAQPGHHVLKFWRVTPGVVLERIVIDAGGVRPSYLGPPESKRVQP